MNHEFVLSGCSNEEVFHVKQTALRIACDFTPTKKAHHIKKPEVWARAICFKALRDVLSDHPHFPFPDFPAKAIVTRNLCKPNFRLDLSKCRRTTFTVNYAYIKLDHIGFTIDCVVKEFKEERISK